MPFFRLMPGSLEFPSPHLAGPDGLLAIGGDFRPERMIAAYSQGIFPWMVYGGEPVWFSPDPRMVLEPKNLYVGRSLAKVIRRGDYELRVDTAFEAVVRECGQVKRPGQRGSWITKRYTESLIELHRMGLAHSVEAWRDGVLVGGLYGIALGSVFFGESMFARAPDASKVAFATFVRQLDAWGFSLIDCQQETEHLARFGAVPWPRVRFLDALRGGVGAPPRPGPWALELRGWDGRTDDRRTGPPPTESDEPAWAPSGPGAPNEADPDEAGEAPSAKRPPTNDTQGGEGG